MHCHLILKRIGEAAATIRQQLGIFECTRQSVLHRRQHRHWLGCVMRWAPECLNIWSQLVTSYNFFFSILQWFCLVSILSQTHFHGPWHCKDTCLTYKCLTINLCFGLPCHLTKFGHGVFLHSLFVKVQVLKPPMHL